MQLYFPLTSAKDVLFSLCPSVYRITLKKLLTNYDEFFWRAGICDQQQLVRFWWRSGARGYKNFKRNFYHSGI